MKASEWQSIIRKSIEEVGAYRPAFDSVIDTLASILEQRDIAYAHFMEDGRITVKKISDRGSVNLAKNPKMQAWCDLNTQALAYWRDLGLTPAGLKRINESAMKEEKGISALEKALVKLGG